MDMNLPDNVVLTKLDPLANWCRKNSLWPMPFATACCGIELMAMAASRHDISRFGAEVFRFTPRQCDLMIVAGRVVMKMMPVLQRIWLQMPEPKWSNLRYPKIDFQDLCYYSAPKKKKKLKASISF